MSTLLDKSTRPLWVWIVVIIVGSLIVIAIVVSLVRCVINNRRRIPDVETITDEPAEKQLTLRRGRIVAAASYESLTGSRFGINSFGGEDDLSNPSVRSKSPFEWWASIRGRSSRLSYNSFVSSSRGPSRNESFYSRPEHSNSKLSIASEDKSGPRTTVTEIKIDRPSSTVAPTFKRSSRSFEPINFSRAFSPQTQRSLATYHHQTLSRIEEGTPRHSIFSISSHKARIGSYSGSDGGRNLTVSTPKRSSGSSFLKVPSAAYSKRVMEEKHLESPFQHDEGTLSSEIPPSSRLSTPVTPTFPEPAANADRNSRRSLWESDMKQQFPSLIQETYEHPDSPEPLQALPPTIETIPPPQLVPLPQPSISSPPNDTERPPTSTKSEEGSTGPSRARSKKGNVLRKKSLRRTEVLSLMS